MKVGTLACADGITPSIVVSFNRQWLRVILPVETNGPALSRRLIRAIAASSVPLRLITLLISSQGFYRCNVGGLETAEYTFDFKLSLTFRARMTSILFRVSHVYPASCFVVEFMHMTCCWKFDTVHWDWSPMFTNVRQAICLLHISAVIQMLWVDYSRPTSGQTVLLSFARLSQHRRVRTSKKLLICEKNM